MTRAFRRTLVIAATAAVLAACGTNTEQVPWRLSGYTAGAEGTELPMEAEFGGSSCRSFKEWRVKETEDVVEVVALVAVDASGGCTDDLVYEAGRIRLRAPIGGRRLTGCEPSDANVDCLSRR